MASKIKNGEAINAVNGLSAGVDAAMNRIRTLKLDPRATLVDAISADAWSVWDASDEIALVADPHLLEDGPDHDDGDPAIAA